MPVNYVKEYFDMRDREKAARIRKSNERIEGMCMIITKITQKNDHLLIENSVKDLKLTRYNWRTYLTLDQAEPLGLTELRNEKTVVKPIVKMLELTTPTYHSVKIAGVTFPTRATNTPRQNLLAQLSLKDNYASYLRIHAETDNEELMAIDPLAVSIRWKDEDIGFIPSTRRELQSSIHEDYEENGEITRFFITGWKIHGGGLEGSSEKNYGLQVYIGESNGEAINLQALQEEGPAF